MPCMPEGISEARCSGMNPVRRTFSGAPPSASGFEYACVCAGGSVFELPSNVAVRRRADGILRQDSVTGSTSLDGCAASWNSVCFATRISVSEAGSLPVLRLRSKAGKSLLETSSLIL